MQLSFWVGVDPDMIANYFLDKKAQVPLEYSGYTTKL